MKSQPGAPRPHHGPSRTRRWFKPASALLGTALATLLMACGPGVVGTGTGASVAADVCAASFASAVSQCTPSGSAGAAASTVTVFVDAQDGAPASLVVTLDGASLTLRLRCQNLSFSGQWSRLDDGRTVYDGTFRSTALPDGTRAFVQAEAAAPGSGWDLQLTLQDPNGATLGGPWLLRRTAQPVVDAVCAP